MGAIRVKDGHFARKYRRIKARSGHKVAIGAGAGVPAGVPQRTNRSSRRVRRRQRPSREMERSGQAACQRRREWF